MSFWCRLRAIHNWLILGGPFDWMMGHNCYEQEDGSCKCNWCGWQLTASEMDDISKLEDSL